MDGRDARTSLKGRRARQTNARLAISQLLRLLPAHKGGKERCGLTMRDRRSAIPTDDVPRPSWGIDVHYSQPQSDNRGVSYSRAQ